MSLLLPQNAVVLPVLKSGEIQTVNWFLLILKPIMTITEKPNPFALLWPLDHVCWGYPDIHYGSFTLFVRRIPGSGVDGCWVSLPSLAWKCSTTREPMVMFPKSPELRRSWCSWCLICSWNIKPRLLLSGPAGFRSPGAFLKWQKASWFSGKAFLGKSFTLQSVGSSPHLLSSGYKGELA